MEPFPGISAILSLVQVYLNTESDAEKISAQDFLSWLDNHKHHGIRARIEAVPTLLAGLEQVLAEDPDDLVSQLGRLGELQTQVIIGLDGFSGLREAVPSEQRISEQALDFIKWFVAQEGEFILVMRSRRGLHAKTDHGERYEVQDERYFDDDLEALSNLGLLDLQPGQQIQDRYRITRLAAKYVG